MEGFDSASPALFGGNKMEIEIINQLINDLHARSVHFLNEREAIVETSAHPLKVQFYRTLRGGIVEWDFKVIPHSA